jgi:hypothetical protein
MEPVQMVVLAAAAVGIIVPREQQLKLIVVALLVSEIMVEMVLPIIPQFTTAVVVVALGELALLEHHSQMAA